MTTINERRDEVRDHYAEVASAVSAGAASPVESVCGGSSCHGNDYLYPNDMKDGLPLAALKASRGCGNPLGEVELRPGMTVLDLGSGGGIDCLIAAAEVGSAGKVYGLDMTDEMIALAEQNKAVASADNVEFVKGFIEDIPLPDDIADIVTSNCVINLSTDKPRVLREAYRVLKTGGQFMVADIVALKDGFDEEAGLEAARIFGCRSGVVTEAAYAAMMEAAGFENVEVRVFKKYSLSRMREKALQKGLSNAMAHYTDEQLEEAFGGAFISGMKS